MKFFSRERLFHRKSKLTKCKTLRTPKNKPRNSKTKQEPPTPPSPNDDGNFNCLECHKVFTNLTLWQEHTVAEHYKSANKRQQNGDTKTFACEICGKGNRNFYYRHITTDLKVLDYTGRSSSSE